MASKGKGFENPEPVPAASQLASLPFLAAVEGYLTSTDSGEGARSTLHRVMNRAGQVYLQQVAPYRGANVARIGTGRLFAVDTGIVGAAYRTQHVWRTKAYRSDLSLLRDLKADMLGVGDSRDPKTVPKSYLAIPFCYQRSVVLIFYSDSPVRNFFADATRLAVVHSMCMGFAKLLDELEVQPLPLIQNFGLLVGTPVQRGGTVYPRIQEELSDLAVPALCEMKSFNFEAATA